MSAGAFSFHAASSLIPYGKKSDRPQRIYLHDEFNPVEIKESFARNFSGAEISPLVFGRDVGCFLESAIRVQKPLKTFAI